MRMLAAVCVLAVVARAQSLADWVPEGTVFFCEFENLARSKERVRKGPLNAAWNDPALAFVRTKALEAWEQAKRENPDGFHALSLLEGRVAFAAFDTDLKTPVILAQLDEKARDFKAALDRQTKQDAETSGAVVREEEIRGFTVTMEYEEGDEPFGYFIHRGRVVLGDKAGLERVAAHLSSGAEGNLGRSETFRTVRARSGERPDLFFYFDLRPLVRKDKDQEQLKRIGFDNFAAVGLQVRLGDDGIHSRLFLHTTGEKRGLVKLLGAPNTPLAPESFVPPTASTYFSASLDLRRFMKVVASMLDENEQAQMGERMDEVKREHGIDIENDILGALGDRVSAFFVEAGGGESPVVTWKANSVAKLLSVVDKLVPDMEKADFQGVPLRSAGQFVGAAPAGHIVAAVGVPAMRVVLLRYGKDLDGLAQTREFKHAAARVPTQATMLYFSNPAWDRGPSPFIQGLGAGLAHALIQKGGGDPSGAKMPGEITAILHALKKYRGVHAWSLSTLEDGLLFAHYFGLKKPE